MTLCELSGKGAGRTTQFVTGAVALYKKVTERQHDIVPVLIFRYGFRYMGVKVLRGRASETP
ncbi:hypothetical protein D3C81_1278000 [compost metagenome]